jgi:hypothetical protein
MPIGWLARPRLIEPAAAYSGCTKPQTVAL